MRVYKIVSFSVVILLITVLFAGVVTIHPLAVAVGQAPVQDESNFSAPETGAPQTISDSPVGRPQAIPDSLDGRPHETDPYLAHGLNAKLRELSLREQGKSAPEIASIVQSPPPDRRGGLPATGTVQVPVFLVDFNDSKHAANQTQADVQSKMFGNGNANAYPYESIRNYYNRSSYGKLTITGTVFDWYRAAHNRTYYKSLGNAGFDTLIKELFAYWLGKGTNFAVYDNDNNGKLDSFFIKWTGPDTGWRSFWWPGQGDFLDATFKVDGKSLGKFVWSYYSPWKFNFYRNPIADTFVYYPQTDMHETGHLLGLPDYYDYNCANGPPNGLGGLDMMDSNWGDHNSFSKFLLGWITPTVVSKNMKTIDLTPAETSTAAVLVMPGATTNDYAEFFMAQYRERGIGNDPGPSTSYPYPASGLLVWHVDASLNAAGTNFAYNNSYSSHKLIRLIEADGLEEIEHGTCIDGGSLDSVNAGDYYMPPKVLNTTTTPNSNNYSGKLTWVEVRPLTAPGADMTVKFAVGRPTTLTATAPATAYVSKNFTIKGWLTYGSGGLGYKTITRQRLGPPNVWVNVATTRTNSTGYYTFSLNESVAGTKNYRTTYAGDDTWYQNATSNVVTVAVSKIPTKLTATVSSSQVAALATFTVKGRLTAMEAGAGGKTISFQRSTDNKTFTTLTTTVTDGGGWYQFNRSETTARTYYYRTIYAGNATYANATSNVVNVTVTRIPTELTISTDAPVYVRHPFTIQGVLSAPRAGISGIGGQNVTLYRWDPTSRVWIAGPILTTSSSKGTIGSYAWSYTSTRPFTYDFRVQFLGSSTYGRSTSDSVTVEVVP